MNFKVVIFFFVLAGALLVGSQSVFVVDQTQQAIVLQLGQPRGDVRGPGLHLKTPFVQNVRYFDLRVLSIDPDSKRVVIFSGQDGQKKQQAPQNDGENPDANEPQDSVIENVSAEPIMVDTFARYKIVDPLQFMKKLKDLRTATDVLGKILNDSTETVLGETTLKEILSPERTEIMAKIKQRMNSKTDADELGIEIVDVRIVRADLTPELRTSTVKQMNSQMNERATERRSKGQEKALEIRSTARKEADILKAEAARDATIIRGEGDKAAIKIYADAFNVDKGFYSFIRSMEAYEKTLGTPDTRLILSPDSDFFKHFKNGK